MPPRLPSDGQFGAQQPDIDIMLPVGHGQVLLQPSSWPARLPSVGQVGVQTHVPCAQWPLVPQPLPPQSQVSMQTPLLQTLPAVQLMPEQRLVMHLPPLHTSLPAHCTPAHGFAAAQVSAHCCPAPQVPLQAFSIVHFPVDGSQYCPDAHVTPAQSSRKQPPTQVPLTQVWPFRQVTPAHGLVTFTQVALQLIPPPQAIPFTFAHGSDWQVPPRQTWPAAHGVGQPLPPPVVAPDPVPAVEPPPPVAVPEVPALPEVMPRPALPLGVPVVPAMPTGVVPDVPALLGPPVLPAGAAPLQPVIASHAKSPINARARTGAAPATLELVIVPPGRSVAVAGGPVSREDDDDAR
jgi:hypothetical protein